MAFHEIGCSFFGCREDDRLRNRRRTSSFDRLLGIDSDNQVTFRNNKRKEIKHLFLRESSSKTNSHPLIQVLIDSHS